jgi:hypothetical protein
LDRNTITEQVLHGISKICHGTTEAKPDWCGNFSFVAVPETPPGCVLLLAIWGPYGPWCGPIWEPKWAQYGPSMGPIWGAIMGPWWSRSRSIHGPRWAQILDLIWSGPILSPYGAQMEQ